MAWSKRTLAVPAIPPSVRLARRWVAEVLEEVGRSDLVESARLGVSELVTNALLHADPPVTIRVRGTVEHPRVEVTDNSTEPPERTDVEATTNGADAEMLATFGRGLDLVASHSAKWGADIHLHGTGKTVWFEPTSQPRPDAEAEAIIFDPDEKIPDPVPDEERITVQLLGMPPALFSRLRFHFYEIARELRLLALAEPDKHPYAVAIAEEFLQVERERRAAVGIHALDEAMTQHVETIDLTYLVPPSAPRTMERIGRLLEEFYNSPQEQLLLTMQPAPEVLELQRWYLEQFVRAGRGEPPTRWEGPTGPSQAEQQGE